MYISVKLYYLLYNVNFLIGHEVVIVKNGHRVCGTGAALANVPIVQNKAYFEMKLQQSGILLFFFNYWCQS